MNTRPVNHGWIIPAGIIVFLLSWMFVQYAYADDPQVIVDKFKITVTVTSPEGQLLADGWYTGSFYSGKTACEDAIQHDEAFKATQAPLADMLLAHGINGAMIAYACEPVNDSI